MSSTYTYIAEIATPEAGVAAATKFTGEVTVAPLAGAHTTTPGLCGGEQAEDAPVPESATVCGLPAAESVMVIAPLRAPTCVGVNVTLMVQLAAASRLPPQVLVS